MLKLTSIASSSRKSSTIVCAAYVCVLYDASILSSIVLFLPEGGALSEEGKGPGQVIDIPICYFQLRRLTPPQDPQSLSLPEP